jgi:hypothetical protein
MKPENIQACAMGCCLYINGERVHKKDFDIEAQSSGQTRIPCLSEEKTKRVAKEVSFYMSVGVVGRLLDKARPIYDPVTHQYLRDSTPTDEANWQTANKTIIKEMKKERGEK